MTELIVKDDLQEIADNLAIVEAGMLALRRAMPPRLIDDLFRIHVTGVAKKQLNKPWLPRCGETCKTTGERCRNAVEQSRYGLCSVHFTSYFGHLSARNEYFCRYCGVDLIDEWGLCAARPLAERAKYLLDHPLEDKVALSGA